MQGAREQVGRPRWYVVKRGERYLARPARPGGLWARWLRKQADAELFVTRAMAETQAGHYDGARVVVVLSCPRTAAELAELGRRVACASAGARSLA